MPRTEKEQRDAVLALGRETARLAMDQPVAAVKAAFSDLPDVSAYIDDITKDLIENVHCSRRRGRWRRIHWRSCDPDEALERFEVNVVQSVRARTRRTGDRGTQSNPPNLVGRVEYSQTQGALITNFRLIKAGALHRANGGTLPRSGGRPHGPVVAVTFGADDPSLAVARRIAEQAREHLLVVDRSGETAIKVPPNATPRDIAAALGDTRERLIVLTRHGSEEVVEFAMARGVPVLLVEPG